MRFDDRIATVMRQPAESPAARAAKWRQLVDLLAQMRDPEPSDMLDSAFDYLSTYRRSVEASVRRDIARSLAGRAVTPVLLRFFADDDPSVAAPLLAGARLAADEWIALLPKLSPTGRALLRHRRDMGPEVTHALAAFGASDFVLGDQPAEGAPRKRSPRPHPAGEGGEAQIRELVARIEAFRRERRAPPAETGPEPEQPIRIEAFRWECAADGVIAWVEGAPRGPLVGQSIAAVADHGRFGVDGQAAGAFEKRAPFRDARFTVPGIGAASGDWRISGVPFFTPETGSFTGYRGSARRPRVDEVAPARRAGDSGLFGTGLPADSLRQLIHELRTPLNAIVGFAEMIDGQYLGPAEESYRSRAAEIVAQAGRLLAAVDDLDTAARLETRRPAQEESSADAVSLLCRLHDSYERVAEQKGSRVAVEIMRDLPPASVEPGALERMFARMLGATIGLAGEGETIVACLNLGQLGGRRTICLTIDRPAAIAGLAEAALLDPGYSPEGDWPEAPALGLGFALRLVRNLAETAGGALTVGDSRFHLHLPPADPAERSTG